MVFGRSKKHVPSELVREGKPYEPKETGVYQDMTSPLAHYFVSSSHNTYLHGHQLVGEGGTEVIVTCLHAGCRVVELDVYNEEAKGKLANKGPQVRHGEAMTSAVTLEDCMKAVREHAFKTSPYPVIATFENHCDEENQVKMAEVITRVLGDVLFVPTEEELAHASPESLKHKVLIRAKVESAKGEIAPELRQLVYIANSKMKAALADMEETPIYMTKGVSCSVEASKIESLLEEKEKVLLFTTRHILRVYPQAWRINSANYNPIPAWNMGAQVVALNWQRWDKHMWLYSTRFADNGQCGYVRKPDWMIKGVLPTTPPHPKLLTVTVKSAGMESRKTIFKKNLEDLMVKVQVVGEEEDCCSFKTRVVDDCWEAHFGEMFAFHVHFPETALLLLQLKDHDTKSDDALGYYGLSLNTLVPGSYKLTLKDPETGNELKHSNGTPKRWITVEIAERDDDSPVANPTTPPAADSIADDATAGGAIQADAGDDSVIVRD